MATSETKYKPHSSRNTGRGKEQRRGRGRGRAVWRSKGEVLLEKLQQNEPSGMPRLCGAPLTADEFLLGALEAREDRLGWADASNMDTFGEEVGWDVDEMFAANSQVQSLDTVTCVVGTCGFMGVAPKKYASDLNVVELNSTFHDRGEKTYDQQVGNYARLGLRLVVKVSGYATHDAGLANPAEWWPWLRNKYASFVNSGVLIALLWQLPPSFQKSCETLYRLDELGKMLRASGQIPLWATLHHVFEFRHTSWYGDPSVVEIFQRHSLCMAHIHVMNDTGWAGDLPCGWHGGEDGGEFAYFRCFGTAGRSLGKYSVASLSDLGFHINCRAGLVVVMFGQADVPTHALENARELRQMIENGKCTSPSPLEDQCHEAPLVSGKIIGSTRGWDKRLILDVGGRRGLLGMRHAKKRGLQMRMGATLSGLRIESQEKGVLLLSIAGVEHDSDPCGAESPIENEH